MSLLLQPETLERADTSETSNMKNKPETTAKSPSESDDTTTGYPDGGTSAWLVVLGAWCAMVPSMGLLNSLAVLQAWLSEHELHGISTSTTGWIFSTYAFFLFFCGAQLGKLPHELKSVVT